MDVSECNGRRLYTGLRLDYRLRLWASTSSSRAISAVAKLLVDQLTKSSYTVREMYQTRTCCPHSSALHKKDSSIL